MSDQQPGTNPAEPLSYDADLMADVRSAFDTPAETAEPVDKPVVETAVAEKTEPKADHPDDPKRYADGKFKPTKEEAEPQPEPAAKIEAAPEAKIEQQP